jgi:hypothetical protein
MNDKKSKKPSMINAWHGVFAAVCSTVLDDSDFVGPGDLGDPDAIRDEIWRRLAIAMPDMTQDVRTQISAHLEPFLQALEGVPPDTAVLASAADRIGTWTALPEPGSPDGLAVGYLLEALAARGLVEWTGAALPQGR